MKKKCGIYKITSPSGKVYIGQSDNITKRWYHYKSLACKRQKKLYSSILKYGVNSHIFEVIELCNFNDLNCRERYWQEFYNVIDRKKGLNLRLTECGDKKQKPSEEVKKRASEQKLEYYKNKSKKVYQYSLDGQLLQIWNSVRCIEEDLGFKRNNIRATCKKLVPKTYNYLWSYKEVIFPKKILEIANLTFSDKIRGHKFNLGKKKSDKTKALVARLLYKPLIQKDLDGNFIKEWESATKVMETLGIHRSHIYLACNIKTRSAGGFRWEHKH